MNVNVFDGLRKPDINISREQIRNVSVNYAPFGAVTAIVGAIGWAFGFRRGHKKGVVLGIAMAAEGSNMNLAMTLNGQTMVTPQPQLQQQPESNEVAAAPVAAPEPERINGSSDPSILGEGSGQDIRAVIVTPAVGAIKTDGRSSHSPERMAQIVQKREATRAANKAAKAQKPVDKQGTKKGVRRYTKRGQRPVIAQ